MSTPPPPPGPDRARTGRVNAHGRRPQRWSRAWEQAVPDNPARLLRRRRRFRAGVVQGGYLVVGTFLGVVVPMVTVGPSARATAVQPLLYGMAGGLISFIALVFSLLFLVVQFSTTTVSPRLTLFRDDPLVWHCFGYFSAVLVYCSTAGLQVGARHQVTMLAPTLAVVLVLGALGLSRQLQLRALRLLQFNSTMDEVRRRGEAVLRRFYAAPHDEPHDVSSPLGPIVQEVRWPGPMAYLVQVDVPSLLRLAGASGGLVELRSRVGDELRRGTVVACVRGDRAVADDAVLGALTTGVDRTFAQDPLLAFRLLSDIANRALSAAINDPATAVHAVGCIGDLLAVVADRRLDFGPIQGPGAQARVQIRFPTWDEVVAAALDEVVHYGEHAPTVAARLELLLEDLTSLAPPGRRPALDRRRARLLGGGGTTGCGPSFVAPAP